MRKCDTSSDRIQAKLAMRNEWCFCEFCWRPTEFSTVLAAPKVVKRLARGNAKIVPLTAAMRTLAQKQSDALVQRFERACKGEFGPYEAGRMWSRYCIPEEMRGDLSVEGFRDHVEGRMLIKEWARHGELVWSAQLPGQPEGAPKPSKLYCSQHNPRRSIDSRRTYQRDRRYKVEFYLLIDLVRSDCLKKGYYPVWDIEFHADIRRHAYKLIQHGKSRTGNMEDLLVDETMSQADIARKLGVSRQAVSAAIKRRTSKQAII